MLNQKYQNSNSKKIKKIIDFYGAKRLFKKSVLDLGAYEGDIGAGLHRLGADVTAVEIRDEHIAQGMKKYKGIKFIKHDLDKNFIFKNKKFDFVLSIDILCHLKNYEQHLNDICSIAQFLVIETVVCDSEDPFKFIEIKENKAIFDSAFNGFGGAPSSASIERILSNNDFSFKRMDSSDLNSEFYKYDWAEKNDNNVSLLNRRLWFCVKKDNVVKIKGNTPVITTPINHNIIQRQNILQPNIITKDKIQDLKIAVVISGHLRTFEKTYKSFINNIIPTNAKYDVFIHTWDTLGSSKSKENSDKNFENIKTDLILNTLKNNLHPKIIEIENNNMISSSILSSMDKKANLDLNDRHKLHNHSLVSFASMLYSMHKVGLILDKYEKDNNFTYDVVIRLRPDLLFISKFDINLPMNKLYIPKIGRYYDGGMNDQFAVGSSKDIKIYLDLYSSILNYINNKECKATPEIFLRHHLLKNNIIIEEKDDIKFHIIRPDGQFVIQTELHQQWKK